MIFPLSIRQFSSPESAFLGFSTIESYPTQVEIIEVGPRDGLQREATLISLEQKVALIEDLVQCGLRRIQVTSFVHPRLVPQMADAEDLCARLPRRQDVVFSGLALNPKGVERAQQAGLSHIDISVSASEPHSQRNANRSIQKALAEFQEMYAQARAAGMVVRGGIQCAFGYQDAADVNPAAVVGIAARFLDLGVDELALADSAGFATPRSIATVLDAVIPLAGPVPVILHLHDTRGLGLANLLAALDRGVTRFDTAFGGLGGCPFIDGAAGNIATEDTVYMLKGMGIDTGVDLACLSGISRNFEQILGKPLPGKVYALAV